MVSVFTGAGGLDIGLELAGFCTVAACDSDQDCVETLKQNKAARISIPAQEGQTFLEGARLIGAPIEDVSASDLRPRGARRSWRPDLLVGGPPCQPFSSAGRQQSVRDPRGVLFLEFVRLARELRPRLVLFENVRGLVTARGPRKVPGEVLNSIKEAFEEIGYATNVAVLNAADYGAPQRRVRLFILASRQAPLPQFPEPTHSARGESTLFGSRKPWVTLGEFLASHPRPEQNEIVRPSEKLAPLLEDLANGSGLKSPGVAEPTRPGGHWGYKQGTFIADLAKPARTVTAASTQDWVRLRGGELRRLSLAECASLQGFPREWRFSGSRASQFRQIGNAVPAVFGQVLGSALLDALHNIRPRTRARSAPLPPAVKSAVKYATRDDERNGISRVRSARFVERD